MSGEMLRRCLFRCSSERAAAAARACAARRGGQDFADRIRKARGHRDAVAVDASACSELDSQLLVWGQCPAMELVKVGVEEQLMLAETELDGSIMVRKLLLVRG